MKFTSTLMKFLERIILYKISLYCLETSNLYEIYKYSSKIFRKNYFYKMSVYCLGTSELYEIYKYSSEIFKQELFYLLHNNTQKNFSIIHLSYQNLTNNINTRFNYL